jgi:hypothetical protein
LHNLGEKENNDEQFENWLEFQLKFVLNTNIKQLKDLKITNSLLFDLCFQQNNKLMIRSKETTNSFEFDSEKESSFLKILNERTYESYIKHIQISAILNNAYICLFNNDFINEDEPNITKEFIWQGVVQTLGEFSKWLTKYTKELDGFNKLNSEDLLTIISSSCFCLYALHITRLFSDSECRMITSNKVQTTKKRSLQIFDSELLDLTFKFHYLFKDANLSKDEIAIFYPFILSSCNPATIKDKESLFKIKINYTKCLIYQFDLNKRDSVFYQKLKECFNLLSILELNKENFLIL